MNAFKSYIVVFALLLLPVVVMGQLYVGEGVTIQEGTEVIVVNNDVIIDTDTLNGAGSITLKSDKQQKISFKKETTQGNVHLVADRKLVKVEGNAHYGSIMFTSPSPAKMASRNEKESIATKNQIENEAQLPVRYINIAARDFAENNTSSKEKEETIASLPILPQPSAWFVSMQRMDVLQTTDYIIPIIYSYTLNERFSDYAEHYKFEYPTATFKPPMSLC